MELYVNIKEAHEAEEIITKAKEHCKVDNKDLYTTQELLEYALEIIDGLERQIEDAKTEFEDYKKQAEYGAYDFPGWKAGE